MLKFVFGVMGSSKTALLLMQRYNYMALGRSVALIKPAVDTRKGAGTVFSRVGLQAEADIVLAAEHSIREQLLWLEMRREKPLQHVFVDEAQFLSEAQVLELAAMAPAQDIRCFGLKTDFRGAFFPGSSALLRFADTFEEVGDSLCWCGAKATMNTRVDAHGVVIRAGEQVLIDNQGKISYIGLCYAHWASGESGR